MNRIEDFAEKHAFDFNEISKSKSFGDKKEKLDRGYADLKFTERYTTSLGDIIEVTFKPVFCQMNGVGLGAITKHK